MTVTFTTPADSFDTVVVTGTAANVDVRTADITEALIEITGPEELIRDARVDLSGTRWVLELPKASAASTVISTGGTTIISGSGNGVFVQAGNLDGVTGSVTTIINGSEQQVHVAVRVPRGTNLRSTLTSGSLTTTHAQLGAVHHVATSGDAMIGSVRESSVEATSGDVTVRTVAKLATIRTSSGDIDVTGGTRVDVRTSSGDIDFAATGDCRVDASTSSGDITIRRNSHQVNSNTRTSSGDVRER